jgi:cytochrome c peroxidase
VLLGCLAVGAASAPGGVLPPHEAWKALYRQPAAIPFPPDDPYTAAKAQLGRMLFFDPILSGPGTRSCASCHDPGLSWSDGLPRAIGQKQLALRTPTLLDVAWVPVLGWDGKFRDLESVAFGPMLNPDNMANSEAEVLRRLQANPGYVQAFAKVFPDEGITRITIEQALATFERTIVPGMSPFDRWLAGDSTAIDAAAKRGFDLFNGKARCAACHEGPALTDFSFQDIGIAAENDVGRGRLFPRSVKLRHAFKVPTLRDVARRAPYMHDGSLPTLEAVVDSYNSGGIDRPSRSELIRPLGLSEAEKADLVAFLRTLTETPRSFPTPTLPR